MQTIQRAMLVLILIASAAMLQGCFLAAAGAAGAAGGYEAHRHGYEVQSPVKQDEAGGYKGQNPVVRDPSKDQTQQPPRRQTPPASEPWSKPQAQGQGQSQGRYQNSDKHAQGPTQQ